MIRQSELKRNIEDKSMKAIPILTMLSLLAAFGCKTTAPVAKVNAATGSMELYTSEDKYSMLIPEDAYLDDTLKRSSEAAKSGDLAQLNTVAQVLITKGELEKAEKTCYEILYTDFKNAEAKMSLAQIALKKNELNKAKLILNGLAADRKNDSRIQNLLGMIAIRQNHNAEALAVFKQGLQINPEDMAIRMNLGVLHLQYRQLNEAAVQFERIISKVPNHSDAHIHLAIVNMARGDVEKAKNVLKEYAARKKDGAFAEYNYASALDQEEKYDEALKRIQSFLENAPKDAERTNAAFALAESIHKKQEALGQKVSREEIQMMAEKFKNVEEKSPAKTAKAEGEHTMAAKKKPSVEPEMNAAAAPVAHPEPAKEAAKPAPAKNYQLEEIDQLEKELQ